MSDHTMSSVRVLLVDEDDAVLDITRQFLEREDDSLDVSTATSVEAALERIGDDPLDVVISDYKMPHMNGVEFAGEVHEQVPDVPFFLFTARDGGDVEAELEGTTITGFVQKQTGTEQYRELAEKIRTAAE
jgi:DNA-binding NtrC family response regulator